MSERGARSAARLAAINALAVARQHLGSLDRVTRIVRLGVSRWRLQGMFATNRRPPTEHRNFWQDVFGKEKNPSRLGLRRCKPSARDSG